MDSKASLGLDPVSRTVVFIDGANLYATTRALEFDIDYQKLTKLLKDDCDLIRSYYYSAIREGEGDEYSPLKPLTDWLSYNGYSVVTKLAREFVSQTTGQRRIKGSMDVEIAVDMLEMANLDKVDDVVLFSGDSDFRCLLETVKRRGVRVTVVSSIKTAPSMISDELRRSADRFVDLMDLKPQIQRVQKLSTMRLPAVSGLVG
jgi:uncharacterized LabA/DUF88 family protein